MICVTGYGNIRVMDIRRFLNDELERRGMTQRELCRLTGILPHRVSEYLSGKNDIRVETLERILKALDLEIRPRRRKRKGR